MALGKKLFEIGEDLIPRGMSTSDDLGDQGFSPSTDAVNLIATPGIAYAPCQPTDKSTNVADTIIASCDDASHTYDRVFVGTAGKFYGWNSTTMTVVATDGTRQYSAGKTDMASYGNYVYGTSATYVWEWQVSGASVNQTYFAFPSSSGSYSWNPGAMAHPCIVYEGNIYYGNGPQLLRQTVVGGTPTEILLLSNFGEAIIALGIDPGSGKMLISTASTYNASDTINTVNRVYYYDGFSNKALKVSIVDDMITAFKSVGSLVYVGYGLNLGYWDGSGIQFLRKLNLSFSGDDLLYKHHMTNVGTTLYVIENRQILAHGPVRSAGNRVFYYAFKNYENSNDLQHITSLGQGIIGMSFTTNKFFTWSTTDVSTTNTQVFKTNMFNFPDEVWLERVRIVWKNQVSNNVDPGSIRFNDENGTIKSVGQTGLFDLTNTSGAANARKDILNVNIKVTQVQCELILATVNPGIMRIIGYGKLANK